MPCCASRRWVSQLVGRRPYGELAALVRASDEVLADLDWVDVEQALSSDPTIGRRAVSNGADGELSEVNRTYQRKFGYAFLTSSPELSTRELIDAARERLAHDPFVERSVVTTELAKIVRLRLAKAFH